MGAGRFALLSPWAALLVPSLAPSPQPGLQQCWGACVLDSRMDFPSLLPPTLFTAGPLGLSDAPNVSFTCSWKEALNLPPELPQSPKVGREPCPCPALPMLFLWQKRGRGWRQKLGVQPWLLL